MARSAILREVWRWNFWPAIQAGVALYERHVASEAVVQNQSDERRGLGRELPMPNGWLNISIPAPAARRTPVSNGPFAAVPELFSWLGYGISREISQ